MPRRAADEQDKGWVLHKKSLLLLPALALAQAAAAQGMDIVQAQSSGTMSQTVVRLEHAIVARHLKILAVIDHSGAARQAGMTLRPTTLVIFGNPALGTRIMQMNQVAGLDLPIKMLVWQDAQHRVWVGYTAPQAFARRYALGIDAGPIRAMGGALSAIAAQAAGH